MPVFVRLELCGLGNFLGLVPSASQPSNAGRAAHHKLLFSTGLMGVARHRLSVARATSKGVYWRFGSEGKNAAFRASLSGPHQPSAPPARLTLKGPAFVHRRKRTRRYSAAAHEWRSPAR